MVLSGGVGVIAVVVFVAALAVGAEAKTPPPGARLGVAATDAPPGLAVLVPRCRSERVVRIEVRSAGDVVRWRIVSRKGSIDERYPVGADVAPFGFVTEVPLVEPLPGGSLLAVAELAGEPSGAVDRVNFDPGAVPDDGVLYQGRAIADGAFFSQAAAAADCGGSGRDLGLVTWLFVVAAAAVVLTYVMMVMRYWKDRRRLS